MAVYDNYVWRYWLNLTETNLRTTQSDSRLHHFLFGTFHS